jgi:hypothetical protein
MEITINETEKTIKLHGNVKLLDLVNFCHTHGIDINEYSILATETIWQYPITIPSIPITPYYPSYPSYPWITTCNV